MKNDAWIRFSQLRALLYEKFHHFETCELKKNHPDHNKFYGATDALSNTIEMLRSAKELHKMAGESGRKLIAYGILNAIYVQQDSVKRLAEVTSTKISVDGKIRTLRNRLAGHPAYADKSGKTSSIPVYMKGGELNFQIYGLKDENKADRFYTQDIDDLISQNYTELIPLMEKIHNDLNIFLKKNSSYSTDS